MSTASSKRKSEDIRFETTFAPTFSVYVYGSHVSSSIGEHPVESERVSCPCEGSCPNPNTIDDDASYFLKIAKALSVPASANALPIFAVFDARNVVFDVVHDVFSSRFSSGIDPKVVVVAMGFSFEGIIISVCPLWGK